MLQGQNKQKLTHPISNLQKKCIQVIGSLANPIIDALAEAAGVFRQPAERWRHNAKVLGKVIVCEPTQSDCALWELLNISEVEEMQKLFC